MPSRKHTDTAGRLRAAETAWRDAPKGAARDYYQRGREPAWLPDDPAAREAEIAQALGGDVPMILRPQAW